MKACFVPTNILLPREDIDLHKWSVIACDQYTSQPEYWEQVESITNGVPSTYKLIYPEVYLGEENNRTGQIHCIMEQYLREGILTEEVSNGFILTERTMDGKVRTGLLGAVDLEQYEFQENISAPIRATEGTILSRIPPRVQIRESSLIESPHAMLLLEDEKQKLIEPLNDRKHKLRKLYDFDLMLGGGHICGYAVEGAEALRTAWLFAMMQDEKKESILAVGDGNHSIAAAKAYWTKLRQVLTEEERKIHPARFALAEIVNLYSPAICFEPIHRIVFGAEPEEISVLLLKELISGAAADHEGCEVKVLGPGYEKILSIPKASSCLCIGAVQRVLDRYVKKHKGLRIDYIHGEKNLKGLVQREKTITGIVLKPMKKEELFPIIRKGEILPRKAFSMGEADEKRYYLECRKISSMA